MFKIDKKDAQKPFTLTLNKEKYCAVQSQRK
jgi:hypothetical protein